MARLSTQSGEAVSWELRTGVKAFVTTSERLLLVAERHADGSRFWTLPGGGVRPDETLVDGLRRELREELRSRPVVGDTIGHLYYAHESLESTLSVYTVFECALLDDLDPATGEGIVDVTWARPGSLPPRTLPQIRRAVERTAVV